MIQSLCHLPNQAATKWDCFVPTSMHSTHTIPWVLLLREVIERSLLSPTRTLEGGWRRGGGGGGGGGLNKWHNITAAF